VFRFPKSDAAKTALLIEASILNRVRDHVEMSVPAPTIYEDSFSLHTRIDGEPLFRHQLLTQSETVQANLARQLAQFLQQLHSTSIHDLPAAEAARSREDWLRLYDTVQRELFPLMMRHSQTVTQYLFEPVLNTPDFLDYTPGLIHGDLAQYHILVDPVTYRINGVIDFGVAGIGDPAVDIGLIINVYGESFVSRMMSFYPAINSYIDRARFYAGTLELQWVLGGVRSGDLSWFTVHLDRARDMLAYGTQIR
jgi:aminoglycoside 2''-phosphotransferase